MPETYAGILPRFVTSNGFPAATPRSLQHACACRCCRPALNKEPASCYFTSTPWPNCRERIRTAHRFSV